MKGGIECSRCIHQADLLAGVHPWTELPCAHCTSPYARQLRDHRQKRQVVAPSRTPAPSPDEFIARRVVLAWTRITRTYPAAAAYILCKLGDQSLSYAAIARRFQVSKTTVQYQISLAVMAEPVIASLLSIDHTRNRKHAHGK